MQSVGMTVNVQAWGEAYPTASYAIQTQFALVYALITPIFKI